jgi:hypothetical protein
MHTRLRRAFFPVLLSAGSLIACTSTQPATDNNAEVRVNRVTGDTSCLTSVNLDRAYAGSLDAVRDLQFTLESEAKDAIKGIVKARTADKSLVTITLTRKADMITHINVNAGSFNQGLAQTVMAQVQERLR